MGNTTNRAKWKIEELAGAKAQGQARGAHRAPACTRAGRARHVTRSRTWAASLLVLGFLAAPASAQIPDAPTLLSVVGLTPDQVQQVMSGQIVRGAIQPASERELVTSMAFLVPTSPSQFVADLKAGLGHKVDPDTLASGVFKGAGSAADLAKLTLEPGAQKRAAAYTGATPGGDLNLSTQEIASFNKLAGSDVPTVTAAVRSALLARQTAYRQQGLAGIAPYARKDGSRSPADELRTATQAAKALQRYAPGAYQMLLDYPNSKPAGTEEVFRWAQINAHGTPTLTLTHASFIPDGNAWVVVQRIYYVSAGFNCVQAIAALLPVQNGTVVTYANRTSTDQVTGFGGGTKRSIGSKLLASQLEALFKKAQAAAKH
jgi:hypothetical protein